MKKLLLNLALFGFIVTSITTVKAITIDLENFSGYGDCKAEECDGTNLVIIGHRMYQLNNPDVVLSGILYTKAQLEYGTEEAPIYYILAGEVKQEIGAVKNGIIPMANKTMDEINGNAYEITYIDGIEMLKDADVTNDATLTDYNNRLNEILSNYTNESGQQILESVVYSEDDNTLTFTVTKDGKEVKLSSFLTETTESNVSIIEAFAAFAENATKVEYTIKGDYTDTVTKDLTGNADPVALAKELLLAIAKENGSKKTTAGSLTYFDSHLNVI